MKKAAAAIVAIRCRGFEGEDGGGGLKVVRSGVRTCSSRSRSDKHLCVRPRAAFRTSGNEVLPQGLGNRMGSIVHAELDLSLFQVAADRLFTKPKRLRHFPVLGSG